MGVGGGDISHVQVGGGGGDISHVQVGGGGAAINLIPGVVGVNGINHALGGVIIHVAIKYVGGGGA